MKPDILVKRASMIDKNIELQEYSFSHAVTSVNVNSIYNSHFTGSHLWNLFSKEAIQLENTWNRSAKIMFDLPIRTHRYLLEPVTASCHVKCLKSWKNFWIFCVPHNAFSLLSSNLS